MAVNITTNFEEAVNPETGQVYREPTWTLRITIFLAYYGIFMSMAAAGVFVYFGIFGSGGLFLVVASILPILLQIWMARGLSNYNQLARVAYITFTGIVILISLLVRYLASTAPSLAAITIIIIASYCFYALVFHRNTVELFSGKYQREPVLPSTTS